MWQNGSNVNVVLHFARLYQHRTVIYTLFPGNSSMQYNEAEFWALNVSLFFMAFIGLRREVEVCITRSD